MSKSCLIFDDDPVSLAEISFLLGRYAKDWKISGYASSISDCENLLKTTSVDVIFCDIHFGDKVIFSELPSLREYSGDIVFISGDNGYAMEAFELSAANYILKPIDEDKFAVVINKLTSPYESALKFDKEEVLNTNDLVYYNNLSSDKKIAFRTNKGYMIRNVNDIVYIKSNNNYSEFFFPNKEREVVAKSISEFEKILERLGFFRIHQSYLVNFKYVSRFDNESLNLYLNTDDSLPVSIRRKSYLLEMLRNIF